MSDTLLMWIFGAAFFLICVLFGLWWHHVQVCRETGRDIAVIKQMLTDIREEIGDHETGMIGQLHRYSKSIVKLNTKLGINE